MFYKPLLIHSISYVGRLDNIPVDTLKLKIRLGAEVP